MRYKRISPSRKHFQPDWLVEWPLPVSDSQSVVVVAVAVAVAIIILLIITFTPRDVSLECVCVCCDIWRSVFACTSIQIDSGFGLAWTHHSHQSYKRIHKNPRENVVIVSIAALIPIHYTQSYVACCPADEPLNCGDHDCEDNHHLIDDDPLTPVAMGARSSAIIRVVAVKTVVKQAASLFIKSSSWQRSEQSS